MAIRTLPLCTVSFTTVYLDAVLKSPQRSVAADAGGLDADAGASKSNRISKVEEKTNKQTNQPQQHTTPQEPQNKNKIKLMMKKTPQAFKMSPYTNCWIQGKRIFEGTPALPPEGS